MRQLYGDNCVGVLFTENAFDTVAGLSDGMVQCVVTSPPYWGLRDYGTTGQIGMEESPDKYVENLVGLFSDIRRVLADDGVLWLNLGDSYAANQKGSGGTGKGTLASGNSGQETNHGSFYESRKFDLKSNGIKPKDLVGIPWLVAFALRADGWYLRSDIVWAKPNPMPESVLDRPTRSHEYIFLLTKNAKYYYDINAIKEPVVSEPRKCGKNSRANVDHVPRKGVKKQDAVGNRTYLGFNERYDFENPQQTRNRRTVWTVTPKPFKGAHFATFPPDLIEPCVLAGSREGDLVLDPFSGSGTTAMVAMTAGRNFVGCDLNDDYNQLAEERLIGCGFSR